MEDILKIVEEAFCRYDKLMKALKDESGLPEHLNGEPMGQRSKPVVDKDYGFIHKHCGEERHKEWQERNQDLVIHLQNHCKLAFTDGDKKEHMFVEVFKIEVYPERTTYTGKLSNDPVHVTNIKYGDEISFEFTQIESVYRNGVII